MMRVFSSISASTSLRTWIHSTDSAVCTICDVRGGSEAFHAYAADNDETIPIGSRIVVVEYFPPRTVVVTRM